MRSSAQRRFPYFPGQVRRPVRWWCVFKLLAQLNPINQCSKLPGVILQDQDGLLALEGALVRLARVVDLVHGPLEVLEEVGPVAGAQALVGASARRG